MSASLLKLVELTSRLPSLSGLATQSSEVLTFDSQNGLCQGLGIYRDHEAAIMRLFASKGATLNPHIHLEQHEWIGVTEGKIKIIFMDNREEVTLSQFDIYHVLPGRPHSIFSITDSVMWCVSIPPAEGYPKAPKPMVFEKGN